MASPGSPALGSASPAVVAPASHRSVRAALGTPTFAVQVFITTAINVLINVGLPYATYSNWGARTHAEQFPSVGVWAWNYEIGSCIALDVLLTHFLLATLCTWTTSGAAQKDVREGKCAPLEPATLARRPWVLTPVNVRSLFWRGLAMGTYFTLLAGVPVFLLVWVAVRGGTWPGYSYVLVKGLYAGLLLAPAVYVLVFLSAIDRRNFPELAYGSAALGASDAVGAVLDGADKAGAGSSGGGYYGHGASVGGGERAPLAAETSFANI
jgi:hypothetical protein